MPFSLYPQLPIHYAVFQSKTFKSQPSSIPKIPCHLFHFWSAVDALLRLCEPFRPWIIRSWQKLASGRSHKVPNKKITPTQCFTATNQASRHEDVYHSSHAKRSIFIAHPWFRLPYLASKEALLTQAVLVLAQQRWYGTARGSTWYKVIRPCHRPQRWALQWPSSDYLIMCLVRFENTNYRLYDLSLSSSESPLCWQIFHHCYSTILFSQHQLVRRTEQQYRGWYMYMF